MKVRVPRTRAIATVVSLAGVFVALGPQACSSPTQSDTRASDTRVSTSSFPLAVALPIPPQSVLTQHNDISRTGAYPYESQLTPASVRTRGLVKQRAIQVDANVQVQTLFTPAGSVFPHDTVYTATLNDTVYAIDATTGAILWTKALVDPTYGACAATDPSDQKVVQARCYPMGITATPVIDGTTGTMYVVYGTRNSNLRGAPLCWTPPPAGVASGILTPTGQPANRYRGCGWTTEDVCPFGCDPTGAAPAAGPCEGSWHDDWFGGPSSTAHGPNPGAGRIYPNSFTDWWDGNSKSAPFNIAWYLAAIDASTGTLLRSVQIQGTGRQGVPFEGRSQQPRPGLLLASGNVYAGFGASSEFETPYHGWLFGYNASTFALAGVWNTTTTSYLGEGGGVWQAGGGVVGDPSGNVYVATGNGIVDEVQNFSNNIVKLPPNLASATAFTPTTSPEGYGQANTSSAICPFNPAAPAYGDCCIGPADANGASNAQLTTTAETYNAAYLNYANLLDYWDLDLGGGGLLFINDGGYQRVLGGGKTGISYLLDPSSMTTVQPGFRAFCDQWTFQARDNYLEYTLGNAPHLHGSPIYWHPSGASGRVYEWSEKDRLKAFTFANGTLSTVPLEAPQEETLANHTLMPGGMLSLSASGTTWGSGVVWATLPVYCSNGTDPNATPAGQNTCGMLIAHDAQTLDQIFATNLEASNGAQIGAPKWSPPTVANGHVFLGTQSPAGGPPAELQIFGLGPLHAAGTPTVGPALAVVGSQVQIWSNQWNVDVPPAPPEVPAYSPFCVSPQVCKIGDVNGDGREDLIALSNDANGIVWADLSNGWSFQAPQQVLSGFCTTGQTCAVGGHEWRWPGRSRGV